MESLGDNDSSSRNSAASTFGLSISSRENGFLKDIVLSKTKISFFFTTMSPTDKEHNYGSRLLHLLHIENKRNVHMVV